MKRLFETADLEAELFGEGEIQEEDFESPEYDLDEVTDENPDVLENLSEDAMEGFPALELTLELADGRMLEYELAAVFVHNEKEYMSLRPKSDSEGLFHIMQLLQGENDEIVLKQIEDEEEMKAVYDTFYELFAEEEVSDGEYYEDEYFEEKYYEEE